MIMACSASSHMKAPRAVAAFDIEGHRGCRGLMPENTIPAMIKALDIGVTTLEMDAAITADRKVILSHDPYFNHDISTAPNGTFVTSADEKSLSIFQMTYAQTQQYDVGKRKHPGFPQQSNLPARKPLLSDVIDSADAYAKLKGRPLPFYNIETKTQPSTDGILHPGPEEFVQLLMDVINNKKIQDRVIIQSFDFRTLKIIREKYAGIRTAALVGGGPLHSLQQELDNLGFVPDIYSPYTGLVNQQLVDDCHAKKMKVIPWTANDTATIARLKSLGVDGIISDYPNLLMNKP
jgi:glycerophosphoryl diester phosphodiesterase